MSLITDNFLKNVDGIIALLKFFQTYPAGRYPSNKNQKEVLP